MIHILRRFFWRLLGVDFDQFLRKNDYILLKDDKLSTKGKGTYDNGAKVWRWSKANLSIGNYCSIAHNVSFIMDEGFHGMSQITNYPFINDLSPLEDLIVIQDKNTQEEGITIGHDVWIGVNSIILPGIIIGNGVTVAAGSVVTKDIPDFVTVAGVPAKIIKEKYMSQHKDALKKIAWWNWDEMILKKRKIDFYTLDIDEFIEKYKP